MIRLDPTDEAKLRWYFNLSVDEIAGIRESRAECKCDHPDDCNRRHPTFGIAGPIDYEPSASQRRAAGKSRDIRHLLDVLTPLQRKLVREAFLYRPARRKGAAGMTMQYGTYPHVVLAVPDVRRAYIEARNASFDAHREHRTPIRRTVLRASPGQSHFERGLEGWLIELAKTARAGQSVKGGLGKQAAQKQVERFRDLAETLLLEALLAMGLNAESEAPLAKTVGVTELATAAGISRPTMSKRIKKAGLDRRLRHGRRLFVSDLAQAMPEVLPFLTKIRPAPPPRSSREYPAVTSSLAERVKDLEPGTVLLPARTAAS